MSIQKETASSYLAAGLSVLPAKKSQKRPAIGLWKTWSKRLPTEIEVDAWFSNSQEGVCLVAGEVSGNLECIDFDCQGEAFGAWKEKIPAELFASLVIESTPSGGKHVVYRSEDAVEGNQKLAQGVRDGKLATLIETRGEGGLFLCAPTPGYILEQGEYTHLAVLSGEARNLLLGAARSLNEHEDGTVRKGVSGAFEVSCVRPGDDFCARGDIRPILAKHGWVYVKSAADGNEHWVRPGKDAQEGISATLKDGLFYVFSSNAAPFEANRAYNQFQVFALLECGNNFSAASAALFEQGYGERGSFSEDVDLDCILEDACIKEVEANNPEDRFLDPGPIPDELYDVPGFISELMGYTLRTAYYPNRALAFAGALALLGHLVGRKFMDEMGTRPNLYILSLAASGTGKQHPRDVNNALAAMKGFAAEMGDYFASGEGLEDSFLTSPSMFYQVDEADTLFNSVRLKDPRAEMLNSMLLRFYSESSSSHNMRKKAWQRNQRMVATTIYNPHLTFLGTAVPRFFYSALSERVMANGLLARCLVFEAGRRGKVNREVSVEGVPNRVLVNIETLLEIGRTNEMYNEFPQPEVVPILPDAKARLFEINDEAEEYYAKYESLGNECALALWARAMEKVHKLSLVRALSQSVNYPKIRIEDVDWAKRLVFHATQRMLFQSGLYTYDSEFERKAKKVIQRLKEKGGRLSYRDILRSISMEKEEMKKLLETLLTRGDILQESGPKGGVVFVLN